MIRKTGSVVIAACLAAGACAAGPSLPSAMRGMQIPVERVAVPPHGPAQAGKNAGSKGSPNIAWQFPGAPSDGFDSVRITISPRTYANGNKNYIYWAFDSHFEHGGFTYYLGMQPNGEFGKTALFSAFGPGTNSQSASCKKGADNGAGTSCHIHYEWQLEHAYELTAELVAADEATTTWEGAIVDVASGARTVIGQITVGVERGLLSSSWAVTFIEYFRHVKSCADEPFSEVLFYHPVGYRNGKEYKGTVSSFNMNTGCGQAFYGNGKDYVYGDVGQP